MKYVTHTCTCLAFLISLAIWVLPAPVSAQQSCAGATWGQILNPGPQTPKGVETIKHPKGDIRVFTLLPLSGPYAKAYVFLLDTGTCYEKVVSFGSYSTTNLLSDDGPLFHADLYDSNSHATLGFFSELPPYDEMRKIALEALK